MFDFYVDDKYTRRECIMRGVADFFDMYKDDLGFGACPRCSPKQWALTYEIVAIEDDLIGLRLSCDQVCGWVQHIVLDINELPIKYGLYTW